MSKIDSHKGLDQLSHRDAIFGVVRPAVRRCARLRAGVARDLRRAAPADVLRRAVIIVAKPGGGRLIFDICDIGLRKHWIIRESESKFVIRICSGEREFDLLQILKRSNEVAKVG